MDETPKTFSALRPVMLTGALIVSCASCSSLDNRDDIDTIGGVRTVEVDELIENADPYMEKKVSVMGEAGRVYSGRAFVLEELSLFFEETVLVLSRSDIQLGDRTVKDDDMLRVEGIVYPYDRTALREQLGWELPQSFDKIWKNKPVVVTHLVVDVYDYGRWEEGVTNRQQLDEASPDEQSPDEQSPDEQSPDERQQTTADSPAVREDS